VKLVDGLGPLVLSPINLSNGAGSPLGFDAKVPVPTISPLV